MKLRVYDFATIGFRPYAATQEFVTIGVIAFESKTRDFDFVLLGKEKTQRISGMFPNLATGLYEKARKGLESELNSIKRAICGESAFSGEMGQCRGESLFAAITSPRDGIFCYAVRGRQMAEGIESVLEQLKARFLEPHLLS